MRKPYNNFIFDLVLSISIITIIIGLITLLLLLTSCNTNPYKQYNCNPCKIVEIKITKYGKTVIIINQDSIEYPLISDSLYEKGVGYIIK